MLPEIKGPGTPGTQAAADEGRQLPADGHLTQIRAEADAALRLIRLTPEDAPTGDASLARALRTAEAPDGHRG